MARPIVSARQAAEWLPADDAYALAWLDKMGLIHRWGRRNVVVWLEVEEVFRSMPCTCDAEEPAEAVSAVAAKKLPRVRL